MRAVCRPGGGCQRGFTLVELMVTIAVLAILAGIGYPLYSDQVTKARRSDARSALRMIAMAQERFYTVNGSYATDLEADDNPLNLPDRLTDGDSVEGHYALTLAGDTASYTLTATAQGIQADDGACAEFTLNQVGLKTAKDDADADSTDACW